MCERSARTWVPAGFLSCICLLLVALILNACSLSPTIPAVSPTVKSVHPSQTAYRVLVTEGGSVTLLDSQTGSTIWQHQTGVTDFTPLIANTMIYIVSQRPGGYNPDITDTLEALSLVSGRLVWRWSWKEHWTPENPPTISNGVIYLSESNLSARATYSPAPLSLYQGFVVALRASDGLPLWKVSLPGLLSPATITNGTVYVSNAQAVLALRSKDGHEIWRYRPAPNESLYYYTQAEMQTRETHVIIAQGNQVYIDLGHDERGHVADDLVALDSHSGQAIWRYHSHAILRPPLLHNGVFYLAYSVIPANSYVVALNAVSGSVLWTYHQPALFTMSQPVLVSNVLYTSEIAVYSSQTSDVVALRVNDGSVLRRYMPHSGQMFGAPEVSQHALHLGIDLPLTQGHSPIAIVALDLKSGREIWRSKQLQPFGNITALPSQDQLYVFSPWDYTPDTLVVFQARNGSRLWEHPTKSYVFHVEFV